MIDVTDEVVYENNKLTFNGCTMLFPRGANGGIYDIVTGVEEVACKVGYGRVDMAIRYDNCTLWVEYVLSEDSVWVIKRAVVAGDSDICTQEDLFYSIGVSQKPMDGFITN